MSTDIVIASAARTAVGSFNGAFGSTPAHELGAAAIKGARLAEIADAGHMVMIEREEETRAALAAAL